MLDTETLLEQTDIVYNCEQMRNIVFLQSDVERLKKKSLSKFNVFKSFLEAEAVGEADEPQDKEGDEKARHFWIFADNYHKPTTESTSHKL